MTATLYSTPGRSCYFTSLNNAGHLHWELSMAAVLKLFLTSGSYSASCNFNSRPPEGTSDTSLLVLYVGFTVLEAPLFLFTARCVFVCVSVFLFTAWGHYTDYISLRFTLTTTHLILTLTSNNDLKQLFSNSGHVCCPQLHQLPPVNWGVNWS